MISAETGHINCHETGAVEATGHKILTIPSADGKIHAAEVSKLIRQHNAEFTVHPKLVYLSNTTELGTQYTKQELEELSHLCRLNHLYLFLDGARLASALTNAANDITLEDLAALTDLFYIGGTKNGALFGEALVIVNPELKSHFRYHLKQRGAMLAKGWLLGLQFETLFTDGLYYELGQHANEMAGILRAGFKDCGFPSSPTLPPTRYFLLSAQNWRKLWRRNIHLRRSVYSITEIWLSVLSLPGQRRKKRSVILCLTLKTVIN